MFNHLPLKTVHSVNQKNGISFLTAYSALHMKDQQMSAQVTLELTIKKVWMRTIIVLHGRVNIYKDL